MYGKLEVGGWVLGAYLVILLMPIGCVLIKDMDVIESDVNLMTMGQEQQMAHGVTESELGAQQHESASASLPVIGE